jgi:hypothetical protein
MLIEQAIYGGQDVGGYRFLARSPGFREEWLPAAERLCTGFGERPAGVACPQAVFARPLDDHVAVVQVADQGRDDAGRPGALGFRLLVLPARLYADLGGDPLYVAEQLPPTWEVRGELPALEWSAGPPPYRTVEQLQKVLDVPNSPTLLGGVQMLVDGGRLVFERSEPDPKLVRSLWALLPTATRTELWPATFAFSNAHGFDVLVVPRAAGPQYERYLTEPQAGDYPEGRYELSLQTAIEAGNQAEVDALFARRSRSQTLRLALWLLGIFLVVPLVVMSLPTGPRRAPQPAAKKEPGKKAALPEDLQLAPAEDYPRLSEGQRRRLAGRLQSFGKRLGVALFEGDTDAELSDDLARLDAAIDARLGAKRPRRNPGRLRALGPPKRQLQALLWKHGVAEYNEQRLNPLELIEKLEQKLARDGILKEEEPARD